MPLPPEMQQRLLTPPTKWGIKRWTTVDTATPVESRNNTPISVGELEHALRIAGTEIFTREKRVSRMIFARREEGEQTVTVLLYSAAERGQVIRLEATPRPLERYLDVNLTLLGGDKTGVEEIATGESMDYPILLTRLKALPQLRSASQQRHF